MIFYFSGTGNTLWVAKQIAEATADRLVDIADEMRKEAQAYTLGADERLGFCFPTHGWQPPRIVRDFIRRSSFLASPSTYTFAITTCGDNMGEAMTIFNQELSEKGLRAESVFSVIMPESYVCLPFMYTDSEERIKQKIENAQQQIASIILHVKEKRRGISELEKGATPRLYSYVIGQYFNKRMITDKKFVVDTSKCIRCNKCVKVCPVDNIAGSPPSWLHNGRCTCCLSCYHHCPVHAINYGTITKKRGQYFFSDH